MPSATFLRFNPFNTNVDTQCLFNKFCQAESHDLQLESEMKREYNAILDSLMEYLKKVIDKIEAKTRKNKAIVLNAWEEASVSSIDVQRVLQGDSVEHRMDLTNFQRLRQRWGGIS